jgi:hypothetical protein
MLRPRESLDQRVLDSWLEISPKPIWAEADVFGNHVAVARFARRARPPGYIGVAVLLFMHRPFGDTTWLAAS